MAIKTASFVPHCNDDFCARIIGETILSLEFLSDGLSIRECHSWRYSGLFPHRWLVCPPS